MRISPIGNTIDAASGRQARFPSQREAVEWLIDQASNEGTKDD
jgi:hypothetical protein